VAMEAADIALHCAAISARWCQRIRLSRARLG
jgi:hypothetical protein